MIRKIMLALLILLSPLTASAQTKLDAVASISIIGDFVNQIGGDRVNLTVLVGPGGDAHIFQPTPADARRVGQSKLVFINGLGLEGWLPRLVKSSGGRATIVTVSHNVPAIKESIDGHGHGHNLDPHAWQDVANAQLYVKNIGAALSAADPDGAPYYAERLRSYLAELDRLEAEMRLGLAQIPTARRRMITSHDAFGYFAKAYGLRFIAPQGVSTEAEASSRDVARIIRQIRAEGIPAVFLENISDPRLMMQIAHETGARIGARVFSDSLSDSSGPAPTYLEMMRNNLGAFVEALR